MAYDVTKYIIYNDIIPIRDITNFIVQKNGKQVSDRVMAWMIYLNTVTDKGQTYFPQHQVKVRKRKISEIHTLRLDSLPQRWLQVKLKQNILLLVGCLLRSRPFMVSIIP